VLKKENHKYGYHANKYSIAVHDMCLPFSVRGMMKWF